MTEKNKGGRPHKYTPEQMDTLVNAYFADCEANEKNITITGLAIFLDTTRESLCDWEVDEQFSDIIKKAKQKVENHYENHLLKSGSVAGAIFALKNLKKEYWKDKQDIDFKGEMTLESLIKASYKIIDNNNIIDPLLENHA